jgi:hypothetical protein
MRTAVVASIALASFACGSSGVGAEGQGEKPSKTALLLGGLARSGFTGTVVVNDTAASSSDSNDSIGTTTTTRSLNNHVTFTVTPGRVVVKIAYEEKSRVDSELQYQYHKVVGYKTEETIASGTRQENASVTVDLRSGGIRSTSAAAAASTACIRWSMRPRRYAPTSPRIRPAGPARRRAKTQASPRAREASVDPWTDRSMPSSPTCWWDR